MTETHLLNQLVRQCIEDSRNWFPDTFVLDGQENLIRQLMHQTVSMFGEAGEFANLVKKVDRGSLSMDSEITQFDLKDELTDVFIYLLNLAGILQIDLLQSYINKRDKNVQRFGKAATNGQRS